MELFKLLGTIAVDNSAANTSIDETADKAETFSGKLKSGITTAAKWGATVYAGAAAAGAGLMKLSSSSAATADNVDKMSQKIGISRQAYQELDFVMSQSGASVDSLQMGMKSLISAMDGASSGTASNVEQFEKLGIYVTDANGNLRNSEDVMWETMSALQSLENKTEKARLANELFGRSGSELMPLLNGEAGSIEEMRTQAHELGLVLDDETIDAGVSLTDTLDQMKRSIGAVVTKLGASLMPIFEKFAKYIISIMPKIDKLFKNLSPVVEELFEQLMPPIMDLCETLLPVILELVGAVIPAVSKVFKALSPILKTLVKLLEPIVDIIEFLVDIASSVISVVGDAISGVMDYFGELIGVIDDTNVSTYKLTEAQKENAEACDRIKERSKELREEYEKNATEIVNETTRTQDLWRELQTLTDETGYVTDANKDRAAYILGELNDALGTEYKMNDNIIVQYQRMQDEIDTLIQKKQFDRLLTSYEDSYNAAVDAKGQQEIALDTATREVDFAQGQVYAAQDAKRWTERYIKQAPGYVAGGTFEYEQYQNLGKNLSDAEAQLDKALKKYEEASAALEGTVATIGTYTAAVAAGMEGNYTLAAAYLTDGVELTWQKVREGKAASDQEINDMRNSLHTQGVALSEYYKDMLAEKDGYDKEGLRREAAKFEEYRKLYEAATGKAYSISENVAKALAAGLEDNEGLLAKAGERVMSSALYSMKAVAQIASPSKVSRGYGRNISGSLALGIEDEAETAENAATGVMTKTLDVFNNAKYSNSLYGSDLSNAYYPYYAQYQPDFNTILRDSSTSSGEFARAVSDAISRTLPEILYEAISSMRFEINNREFARLVRKVN